VQTAKEQGPYGPSSSAKADAEEATVRSPLLKAEAFRVITMKFATKKDPAEMTNNALPEDQRLIHAANLS